MKMPTIKNILVIVSVFGLLAIMAPSAKANLSLSLSSATYCSGYTAPSGAGSLLYQCDTGGHLNGLLQSSYNCSSGFNSFNYVGGSAGQGTCLVIKCNNGGAYVWDIGNWNGTDQISCNFNPRNFGCNDFEVYGNCQNPNPKDTSSVPEPSTIIAGALLLLPLGVSSMRVLRRKQNSGE